MIHFTRQGNRADIVITGNVGESRARTPRNIHRLVNLFRADEGELQIYEPIEPDDQFGISAKEFSRRLAALGDDVDYIDLFVNSPGGCVFDSLAIHSMLQRHPARIAAHIDGLAASAASFIPMAADSIDIAESGRMMIHNASALVVGDHRDMRQVADVLESLSDTIAGLYAARSGRAKSTFARLMNDETWFDANQAIDYGLADSVTPLANRSSPAAVKARLRQIERDDRAHRFSPPAIAARLRELTTHR